MNIKKTLKNYFQNFKFFLTYFYIHQKHNPIEGKIHRKRLLACPAQTIKSY